MRLRDAYRMMITTTMMCLAVTHIASAQAFITQSAEDQVWRCSLDGKFYTVTSWNGLHIKPISSGLMMAEVLPLTDKKGRAKTDRKGNNKLEGRWGSSTYGGLIVVQDPGPDKIRGFVLAPAPGIPASSCGSRTAAALLSLGQPAPICKLLPISWDLQSSISVAQASAAEALQDVQQRSVLAAQQSRFNNDSDQQLVGTWHKQVFDGYAYYTTTLVLRNDGSYTKSLIGTNHSGTWTSSGSFVHLSGDGHYPSTDENISLFRRVH